MATLSDALKTISTAQRASDFILRVKGFKKIAQKVKGLIKPGQKSPTDIISILPKVITPDNPYFNIYKKSSYYQAHGFSIVFASRIAQYL